MEKIIIMYPDGGNGLKQIPVLSELHLVHLVYVLLSMS